MSRARFGEFEEGGVKVVAEYDNAWHVTFTRGGETREVEIPMEYEPRWGPDVADVAALEARTDEVLREMGAA